MPLVAAAPGNGALPKGQGGRGKACRRVWEDLTLVFANAQDRCERHPNVTLSRRWSSCLFWAGPIYCRKEVIQPILRLGTSGGW